MPIPPDACQRLRQRGNTGERDSVLYLVFLALLLDKSDELGMFVALVLRFGGAWNFSVLDLSELIALTLL